MDKDRYDLLSSLHEPAHALPHEYHVRQQLAGEDHLNPASPLYTVGEESAVREQPHELVPVLEPGFV